MTLEISEFKNKLTLDIKFLLIKKNMNYIFKLRFKFNKSLLTSSTLLNFEKSNV